MCIRWSFIHIFSYLSSRFFSMEKLFHYVWKHRLFPLERLCTTDGRAVEVVDVGLQNQDAGPDFFNAKVKIAGQLWVGNVELHLYSSQWKQHRHDKDKAYNNVILHVVCNANAEVFSEQGERIPQVELPIPERIKSNYNQLLREDRYPRCHKLIPHISHIVIREWLSQLFIERLERKTRDILVRLEACNGSWENVCFQTLARNFGFGLNTDAFEQWAKIIPLNSVAHHRDNLFQVEAIFFGQAGLLEKGSLKPAQRKRIEADEYFQRLSSEFRFLKHKFALTPMAFQQWRFLRLRPPSFPTIRLSQLAQLYHNCTADMSQLLSCETVKDVEQALSTHATEYWQTHYMFGEESAKQEKRLSGESIKVIIINTIVPLLYAYGTFRNDKKLKEKALHMVEKLSVEKNNIIRLWRECGLIVQSAQDSQALIQLKKEYCDRKDCLRCRIGYYYLKIDEKGI